MNLRKELTKLIMRKTYSRLVFAEELTDEIIKIVNLWDKEKQNNN